MEGVLLDKFNKFQPLNIPMEQFRSCLSDESYQYASTTETQNFIILQFLLAKTMMAPFLATMWDHTNGCTNWYCFASAIYVLSCLTLEFSINIDR